MAGQQRTLLKANDDFQSQESVDTDTLSPDDGHDVTPETVHKAILQLAEGQQNIAYAMSQIANTLTSGQIDRADDGDYDEDDGYDDEPGQESDGKEDKAKGGYGSLAGAPGRRKLSKDNSSSNFGELDSDEPGNRPFDPKNTQESDTVITGKTGTGPGPMGGGLRKAITDDVTSSILKAFEERGVLPAATSQVSKSAQTPEPGAAAAQDYTGGQINKAVEETTNLVGEYAKLSWHDLNRARFEMVPGSLLPFPIFGQPFGL